MAEAERQLAEADADAESASGVAGAGEAGGDPATARPFAALAGTLAIQVVATAATLAFAVLSPVMPEVPASAVGVFLAVVYLGAMAGSVIGGGVVNALGPVRASQAALLLQACALALLASGDAPVRLLAAFLCGLGYGPITPASSQLLARSTTPGRIGLVFSLKQTGVPLGGLLAGAALPPLAALASWRVGLVALALLSLVVALACQPLRGRLDAGASGRMVVGARWYRPIVDVLANPRLRSMAAVSLLFSACQLSVSGYLMIFLHREIGMGLVQAGLVFAIAQGAGIVGRVMWGYLADRTGSPRAVLLGVALLMSASVVATGCLTAQWPLAALCTVAAVLGATAIGWNGVYLGEVARLAPPGQVAAVTGGALFFTYIGVVTGPLAFGFAAELAGNLGAAYLLLTAVPLAALLLLGWPRPVRAAPRFADD